MHRVASHIIAIITLNKEKLVSYCSPSRIDLIILTIAGYCINAIIKSTEVKIIAERSFFDYLAITIVTDIY